MNETNIKQNSHKSSSIFINFEADQICYITAIRIIVLAHKEKADQANGARESRLSLFRNTNYVVILLYSLVLQCQDQFCFVLLVFS